MKDAFQLAVGVTFDFDSNEWIAKFGNTINIFPLPNKVAETPVVEEQLGGALAGISVPKYPFEQVVRRGEDFRVYDYLQKISKTDFIGIRIFLSVEDNR